MIRRLSWLLALFVLVACGSDSPDTPNSISVTTMPDTVDFELDAATDDVEAIANEGINDALAGLDDALAGMDDAVSALPSSSTSTGSTSSGVSQVDRALDSAEAAERQADEALERAEELLDSAESSPNAIDTSLWQTSDNELFEVLLFPKGFERVGTPMEMDVQVMTADMQPVEDATLTFRISMPEGDGTFDGQPSVAQINNINFYAVTDFQYEAAGWWEIEVTVSAENQTDTVRFNRIIRE